MLKSKIYQNIRSRSFLSMYNIGKVIGTGRQLTETSMKVRSILCQFDSI